MGRLTASLAAAWNLSCDTAGACFHARVFRLAAALAFYALLSLAPLLVISVAALRLVLGDAADEAVIRQASVVAGEEGSEALQTLVRGVELRVSLGTTLIGALGLVFGASALFNHLKDSLNTIWEVVPRSENSLRRFFIDRCISILLAVSVGVLALVGVMLSIEIEALARTVAGSMALPWALVRAAQMLVAVAVVMLLIALTYRLLPDTQVAWGDIFIGAAVTAVLLVTSQALLGLYLRSSLVQSAYGVIGAVVVLLTWVYAAGLIFFIGAAFTRVYANRHGERMEPAPHALSVAAGDRAAQGLLRAEELEELEEERGR